MKRGEIFMAGVTAFVIGAAAAFGAAIAAGNGKLNWAGAGMVVVAGLAAAGKDYRSLKRLPPVDDEAYKMLQEYYRTQGKDVNGDKLKE